MAAEKTAANDDRPNVGAQRLAAEYAKALYAAAEKTGALDAVAGDLDGLLDEVVARYPKLVDILVSGIFTTEHKQEMIDRALGNRVHPLTTKFLKVLAAHRRARVLVQIRGEFRKLYDRARGRTAVRLTTAVPLEATQQTALAGRLRTVLGGEPILHAEVDPNLLGGLVVQVGDVVYDGSLAANLKRLREQLINRSVHEIQRRRDRVRTTAGN